MRCVNHQIALALFCGLLVQPSMGSAQALTEISFSTVSAGASVAAHTSIAEENQPVAFNWMANGVSNPSTVRANADRQKYRAIKGTGSWICSPAGFGRNSVCYAG